MPDRHVVFDIAHTLPIMSGHVVIGLAVLLLVGLIGLLLPISNAVPRWLVVQHSRGYSVVWLCAVVMMAFFALGGYAAKWWSLRQQANSSAASVVSGCFSRFHPSSGVRGDDTEMVDVSSVQFTYSDDYETPAFHQTIRNGGMLRPDAWARITHVGNDITKVEIVDRACPAAPIDASWRLN